MWRRRSWRFYFGFPPFGFYWHGLKPFPSKEEYISMLQEYRDALEEELKEVEKDIEEIKKSI
ncbi:MAG: hypothetical protein JW732_00800 [Dehalococcoidia bacterium]|nr:hypothetical protein [Dehalococcoidia bacterium]